MASCERLLRVSDSVIWRVVPQPTEWQNIGNEINAGINVFLTLFRPDLITAIAKGCDAGWLEPRQVC